MKKLLPVLILSAFTVLSFRASAQFNVVSDAVELQVLKDLFDSLGGTAWTNKTNWPTPGNWPATATYSQFGTWYGVSVYQGDIVQIGIPNNNLTGHVPASISNLTRLERLFLQTNHLNGRLPLGICNSPVLNSLNLSNNQLSGSLPTQIGNLHLVTVDLSFNSFSGQLPSSLGNLTGLQNLWIHNNQFSGPIPSTISNCYNLRTIYLYNNIFNSEIPDMFGQMTHLTDVRMQTAHFTGPLPPSLNASGSSLIRLLLQGNQLTGSIPSAWTNMTVLGEVNMQNNQLSGELPSCIGNWTGTGMFLIDNNKFSGEIPSSFSNCHGMFGIGVSNNRFTGPFPSTASMPSLTAITATNNGFTTLPSSLLTPSSLISIAFDNNDLTSVPNFSTYGNKANLVLKLQNNRLDFHHLEPMATGFKAGSTMVPQKTINDQPTLVMPPTGALVITARTRGAHTSKPVWEKQSANGTWSAVANDDDTVAITYTRNSPTKSDEGPYRWKTTSSTFPGTTIQSDPIVVKAGVEFTLDNWAFQYRYDGRRRMTHKKVPGADWVYMVYDDRDRLVMTQDGEQRKKSQWTYTKYDVLNRPIMTGLYTHTSVKDQAGMSALIQTDVFYETYDGTATSFGYYNSFGYTRNVMPWVPFNGTWEPLTVTYYDSYDFLGGDSYFTYKTGAITGQEASAFTSVKGLVTGTWTRVLGTEKHWLRAVNYYDDKYRVIQTISDSHKRGQDILTNVYDFTGKVMASKTEAVDHHVTWGSHSSQVWITEDRLSTVSQNTYAYSTQQLSQNANGWVEFTVSSNADMLSIRTVGLSKATNGLNVDWGVKSSVYPGTPFYSEVQASEGGAPKGAIVRAEAGDVIRIERKSAGMYYYRNGIEFYKNTSLTDRSAVYAQVQFNYIYSQLFNPRMSTANFTKSIERHFEYDHAGRLLKTLHSIDGGPQVLLNQQEYNELGQLVDKKFHSTNNVDFRQSLDYRYNIRGWLTSINGAQLTADSHKNPETEHERRDLFGIDLLYNEAVSGLGNTSMYNGNISAMRWSNNLGLSDVKERGYKFDYDPMNRLTAATQKTYKMVTAWTPSSAYHESGLSYDLNGNIKTLLRTTEDGVVMDSLNYKYGSGLTASNMLLKVNDSGTTGGFADAMNVDNDYTYDANGNLTSDKNKSITSITYNYLNLPDKVVKSTGDALYYTYDATGRKLTQAAGVKKTDYRGEWFYENDTLRFVNHEEGRAVPSGAWTSAQQLLPDPDMNTTTANFTAFTPTNITMNNVTSGGQGYLKVLSNQSTSTPGFTTLSLSVIPGRSYTLKLKGYSEGPGTGALFVQAAGTYLGLSIFPGPSIPQSSANEGWVELTFKVPGSVNTIQVGALWKSGTAVSGSSILYINKMELYEYNGIHGNTTFSQTGYEYQYHLKDHLGNVRMTFTTKDEVETSTATVEAENAVVENGEFLNYNKARRINHPVYDHTYNLTTPPNGSTYAIRLNGSVNERIGLAKSLSVMPGDTLKIEVFAKYYEPPSGGNPGAFVTLMAAIMAGAPPGGTFIDGGGYATNASTTVPGAGLPGKNSETGTPPKAYLNWLVFDRDYRLILSKSGYKRIGLEAKEDATDVLHQRLAPDEDIVIGEAGYAYIYLSNENENPVEVYFDDFKVEHVKSPVIQSDDYYPFGLTFNSYSRENSLSNQYQYNGKEKQDELSLDWLDYGQRMYHSDIGRFFNQDRFSEKYLSLTPYHYGANNPLMYVDINGDSLVVTGSSTAQQSFTNTVNEGLGGFYNMSIDGNGQTSLGSSGMDGDMTKEQAALYNTINEAIGSQSTISIETVNADPNVTVGNIITNQIDVADIQEFDKAGPGGSSSAGALSHEVKEQQLKAEAGGVKGVYPAGAGLMHHEAKKAENRTNGNVRVENPTTGTNIFYEKDGTKTSQTVNPNTSTGVATVTKVKIP